MSGTRLIFHLTDEDDDLDGGVATIDPAPHLPLDASWPEKTSHADRLPEDSERDDLEPETVPEFPASGLGAQPVQDLSEPERGVHCEPEPGPLGCKHHGGDPYVEGRPQPEEDTYVSHRALPRRLAEARLLRARSDQPRLSRRAFALGALTALAVLALIIAVHSHHPASLASAPAPTHAAGAARSESTPGASAPANGKPVRKQASVAPREPRPPRTHLAAPRRARQEAGAQVTLSPEPATTTRSVPASTPAPAPEVAPASQPAIRSPYAEFSFER
jgi:hypothetical protein